MSARRPSGSGAEVVIRPFNFPRRLTATALLARFQRRQMGDCYQYAFNEFMAWAAAGKPAPVMRVLHGTVAGGIEHAWIERGGFAYDWQGLAVHGRDPEPVAAFYERARPDQCAVYSIEEFFAAMSREGHKGPWPVAEPKPKPKARAKTKAKPKRAKAVSR